MPGKKYSKEPSEHREEPIFLRGEVAKILNVKPLTIANREKAGKYPSPDRDVNEYRIYSLNDVFNLQMITFGKIDTRPVLSILYDKGWQDTRQLGQLIEKALKKRRAAHD